MSNHRPLGALIYLVPLLVILAAVRAQAPEIATSQRGSDAPAPVDSSAQSDPPAAELLDGARAAYERGDLAEARKLVKRGIEQLLAHDAGALGADGEALLYAAGSNSLSLGELSAARRALKRVVEERERRLQADDPELAVARSQLANVLRNSGDLATARKLAERALESLVRALPPEDPRVTATQATLGIVLAVSGRHSEAEVLFAHVLEVRERTLSSDDPELNAARAYMANALKVRGDLQSARLLDERVLEFYARTLPPDHPNLTAARQNLGVTLHALGEWANARKLFEQVLEVQERTLPRDHPGYLGALENLALNLQVTGEAAAARPLLERVLETRERTLPPHHPQIAATQLNLSTVLHELGELLDAREQAERAVETFERVAAPGDTTLARANLALATVLHDLGELPRALTLAEIALESLERTLPIGDPLIETARMRLADTLRVSGDLFGARELLERSLTDQSAAARASPRDLAATLQTLAATMHGLGDLPAARALQERALELFEGVLPQEHEHVAVARMNLSNVLDEMGESATSRRLLEHAFSVLERTLPRDHPYVAGVAANLAASLEASGEIEAALALKRRTLDACERSLPLDHPDLASARQNLAVTLVQLGQWRSARAELECALDSRERTFANESPVLASNRAALARLLATIANEIEDPVQSDWCRSRCESLLSELLHGLQGLVRSATVDASPRELEERVSTQTPLLGEAVSILLELGDSTGAPELLEQAFLLSESMRAPSVASARLAACSEPDETLRQLREEVLSRTQELARRAQTGTAPSELDSVRRSLERAQREVVLRVNELVGTAAALTPTLQDLVRDLSPDDAIVTWRRLSVTRRQPGSERGYASVDSLVAFVLRPAATSGESVAHSSRPRLAIVDLGAYAPIEAAAAAWRGSFGVSPATRGFPVAPAVAEARASTDVELAQRVRQLALDPLHTALDGASRWILAVDDILHAVPLDVLPAGAVWARDRVPKVGHALLLGEVLRFEVRASLIERLLPRVTPREETTLVAFGGPDFERSPERSDVLSSQTPIAAEPGATVAATSRPVGAAGWTRAFRPLPGSAEELAGVVAEFERGTHGAALVFSGRRASREALLEFASRARWLHLATHGWFAPESVLSSVDVADAGRSSPVNWRASARIQRMSPMVLCGVALCGANLPADARGHVSGLVTAQEIASIDLSHCELVVLSACDTNVGIRRAGLGVASLQQALHSAGAESAITSLWKVGDEAARDLMLDFYRRHWIEAKPKAQALWEAKLQLRDAVDASGSRRYAPRDWAGWVLSGASD